MQGLLLEQLDVAGTSVTPSQMLATSLPPLLPQVVGLCRVVVMLMLLLCVVLVLGIKVVSWVFLTMVTRKQY